jgi:hypothetical protein
MHAQIYFSRGLRHVRFVPILLQKSAMTSRGGLAQTF